MITIVLLWISFRIINNLLKDEDKNSTALSSSSTIKDVQFRKDSFTRAKNKFLREEKYVAGTIVIVREVWNKKQVQEQPQISTEASLIYTPQKWFYSGPKAEQYKSAIRYFNDRVNYIYTRRFMFNYLSHIQFALTLETAAVKNGRIIKREKVAYINFNSSVPADFSNGLYKILNKRRMT